MAELNILAVENALNALPEGPLSTNVPERSSLVLELRDPDERVERCELWGSEPKGGSSLLFTISSQGTGIDAYTTAEAFKTLCEEIPELLYRFRELRRLLEEAKEELGSNAAKPRKPQRIELMERIADLLDKTEEPDLHVPDARRRRP